MSKIPNNPERQLLENLLDSYSTRKSELKRTQWYKNYKKNTKPSVLSLYRLRLSILISDSKILIDKTIFRVLSILPAETAIKILYFLIRLKGKSVKRMEDNNS